MRHYTQLTEHQRYQICALMKAGHTQTEIAALIGVHKSTISRELRRNRGLRGYRPRQAQLLRQARREASQQQRLPTTLWERVEVWLRDEWSPEQISDWLHKREGIALSHELIYHYIYQDKADGGDWEVDTVIGKGHRQALVTLSERKSMYTLI